ncbi:hypothetical protein KI688_012035 [Linnemannia hyalina]|uniref:Uncharacterized protein n=1 Tax=Linnemannia hyalina TaxID=64524 RepID=A0A9P8BTI6_9FUNG|nr:hypothetical protein KI688_012035 [Linnemannia hyalina]
MAGKVALLRPQHEREMEKNLLENQAQLFDAKDGLEDMGPKLSSREQPRRAAAQVKRGRVWEVESLSEDEDDRVTPSTRGPKRERQSERRKENYIDDVESGEDGDEVEVEDEGDVDMSGEDVDSDGDEDDGS